MKRSSKAVLIVYAVILLWLVLFKFSFDIARTLSDNHTRILNLIPFADYSRSNAREMIYNALVFIPFGILLCLNLQKTSFRRKLMIIFTTSFLVESAQLILMIGVADITDLIMNTIGGLLGLLIYGLLNKVIKTNTLNRAVIFTTTILITLFLMLRITVFKVRYSTPSPPARSPGQGVIIR